MPVQRLGAEPAVQGGASNRIAPEAQQVLKSQTVLFVGGEEMTLSLNGAEGLPLALSSLEGEVVYMDGDLLVPRLKVERPGNGGGRLELNDGILDLEDPTLPLYASIEIDDVALGRVLTELGVEGVPVDAELGSELSVEGWLLPLALDVSIAKLEGHDVIVASGGDDPIVRLTDVAISGRAAIEPQRARLEDLSIELGRTTLGCSAELPFDPSSPTFSVNVAPIDSELHLDELGPIASKSFEGHGHANVRISGVYADPMIDADVSFSNFRVDTISLDRVRGQVRYQSRELAIPEARASLGRSVVRIEEGRVLLGERGTRAQAVAHLEPLDLTDAIGLAGLSGPATKIKGELLARAEVSYDTASKALGASVEGELNEVGFSDASFGSGPLELTVADGSVKVGELLLRRSDSELGLSGSVGIEQLSGTTHVVHLQRLLR